MAHFYDHHYIANAWHSLMAALTADHLTAGQRAIRAVLFVALFAMMAMPLLLDLFR